MQPGVGDDDSGNDSKIKEAETKLLITKMLYTTTIDDYDIVSMIRDLLIKINYVHPSFLYYALIVAWFDS